MEDEEKQTVPYKKPAEQSRVSSSPTHSSDHGPPARLPEDTPARSSISSNQSRGSSISHGFSPNHDTVPESPPIKTMGAQFRANPPKPEMVVTRSVREEPMPVTWKYAGAGDGFSGGAVEEGSGEGGGGGRLRKSLSILRRTKREKMVKEAALGLRVCGMVFCLISFSVMAANKNKGWALDSFDRYKEFRYAMAVNVIGFVYSGGQACFMAYHLATGKYVSRHQLRYFLDFSVDQIMTYLLISASSSAAIRVDDWQSNWGKDKFPEMARASVIMSFLAFVALALSSLISGYTLCNSKSL
ncbi:CASP-like protein 4A3 [Cornus florida]|uniref:CASP-like protein 4A3 n=1 Tax=Cornus florida TaxID=4283 RepID=UPI00289ADB61|nr:CASP-like protein 4A3 [Cornus florida]